MVNVCNSVICRYETNKNVQPETTERLKRLINSPEMLERALAYMEAAAYGIELRAVDSEEVKAFFRKNNIRPTFAYRYWSLQADKIPLLDVQNINAAWKSR